MTTVAKDDKLRSHLRTLQVEIISLCHKRIQRHRNIVDLVSWGYDYPAADLSMRLPVLIMEKAMCSLYDFLHENKGFSHGYLSADFKLHMP